MLGKGLLFVGIGALSAFSSASLTATQIYPCDTDGSLLQPRLGEDFYLSVSLQSDHATVDPATIHFSAPSGDRQTPQFNIFQSDRIVWGPFRLLMDAPMSIDVKLLESGQVQHVTVQPTEPLAAVELYAPAFHLAHFSAVWAGATKPTKWWLPVPPTGPFQSVTADEQPGTFTTAGGGGQQISVATSGSSVDATISFTGSSVRTSSQQLRAISFKSLDSSATAMKPWLAAETYMPTQNRTIVAFVDAALGKSFRTRLTPYDAAQAIYLSTIKKLAFVPIAYAPDSVKALNRGNGDCGSFSSLFVTACRNAGIPARPACGFVAGANQWHVWAEFWLPSAGWIPVDPAYADGLRPQGDMPLFFGVVPDLDNRLVTSYGFDRTVGKEKIPMLQSPAAFLPSVRTTGTLTTSCTL